MKKLYISLFIFCTTAFLSAFAQPGSLDPAFGINGKVVTALSNAGDYANAIIKLSTGKILVAGNSDAGMGFAQYNNDGSTDTSFNGNGTLTMYYYGIGNETVAALAEQQDGKIIAVGHAKNNNTDGFVMAVLRLNPDGTLDETFGTNGKKDISFTNYQRGTSVAIQPNGKIIVGGLTDGANVYKIALARLNTNGSYDTTFSEDGKQTTIIFGRSEYITSLALQPDGKIVAAGGAVQNTTGAPGNFAVVRYLNDGSLDTTFSADGIFTFLPAVSGICRSVLLQPDGKIIAGGYAGVSGSAQDFALARITIDGQLDTTFSQDGLVTTPVSVNNDWINGITLQTDGKIIAVGDSSAAGNYDFALVRYTTDGIPDNTFGTNGIVTTDFYGLLDRGAAGVLDGDTIIVTGGVTQSNSGYDFGLARYIIDGNLDINNNSTRDYTLFPNPAKDFISVRSSTSIIFSPFTITDVLGTTILTGVMQESNTIDVHSLQRGLYIIKFEKSGGIRFLKE